MDETLIESQAACIIGVHIPTTKRARAVFSQITQEIRKQKPIAKCVILMGDFNAHIRNQDQTNKNKNILGPNENSLGTFPTYLISP